MPTLDRRMQELLKSGLVAGQREPSLEDNYPNLRDMIKELRGRGVNEQTITEFLAKAESTLKGQLKGDFTPAEVDVHVFGRKPSALGRFALAAGGASAAGFLRPGTPEQQEQTRVVGGAPEMLGQLAGSLTPFALAGKVAGLIPAAARHPLLADIGIGAGLEGLEQLSGLREPSATAIGTQGLLFGGIGAGGRALTRRRALPGTRPPPSEPVAPRVPPPTGVGPFEPGGESPLFGRQEPTFRGDAGLPEPRPFIGGGEAPIAGMEAPLAASVFSAEQVVQRAPAWVQDTLQASLPRPIAELIRMEKQPAEALLKKHFATKSAPGYEDTLTLNMGFNPFQPIGAMLRTIIGTAPAGSEAIANALRAGPKARFISRLRTPMDIFRDTAFLERLNPRRALAQELTIQFENVYDDITKGLTKEQKLNLFDAANSESVFNAAAPEMRAATTRYRQEFLDTIFQRLKETSGVRGREELGYLPNYMRHILDRRETLSFLRKAATDFRGQGLGPQAAEMEELARRFAVRGNAAFLMDEDASRLFGANARDFFKDTPPAAAVFGAMESRLANLPTFIRDLDMVSDSYLRGAVRKIAYDPILKDLAEDVALLDGPLRERAVRFTRELLGFRHPSAESWDGALRAAGVKAYDLFGVDPLKITERFRAEDMSRWAVTAEYYRTLYGNGGGAIINMLQTASNTFPALAQEYGGTEAAGLMMRAMRLGTTAEGRQIMKEIIGRRGARTAGLEGRQTLEGLVGFGDLFGIVETGFNQRIAGLAKYIAETERGVARDVAIKGGRAFIDKTQFMLDPFRRPEIFRGPLGKFMGQFQAFQINQIDFFLHSLDKTGKAYFLGMLTALGGPSAVPFLGPWMKDYFEPKLGFDPSAGLPGLAGLNLGQRLIPFAQTAQRSMSAQEPETRTGRAVQGVLGPGPGLAIGLFEGLHRYVNAAPYAGAPTALWYAAEPFLREVEPVVATRLAQAQEVSATGQLRAGRPSGITAGLRAVGVPVPPVRFGGASLGLQARQDAPGSTISGPLAVGLGVPTQRQRELDMLVQEQRQAVEAAKAQRTAIATAYLHFKATGDAEPLRSAIRAAPGADVRRMLLDLEKPAERRLQQRTPQRFRGGIQQ